MYESVLTSEFWSDECLLVFLLMVYDTASSISPIKLSSFSAVSGRHTWGVKKLKGNTEEIKPTAVR